MEGFDIGYLTAFAGGLLSFLSPCVLPLVPPYLAYLAGTTVDQMTGTDEADPTLARRVFISAVFFVLGLATVFIGLGATASAVGQVLARNKEAFGILSGFVILGLGLHFWNFQRIPQLLAGAFMVLGVMAALQGADFVSDVEWLVRIGAVLLFLWGLYLTGVEHIAFLQQDARFDAGRSQRGYVGAYVIGLAFAFGWTPCVGPILGAILFIAAQQDTIMTGVSLLATYSLGLGLPFLVAAAFVRPFMRFMRRFRAHMGMVEKVMGLLLIVVGVMFVTGAFTNLSFWLLEVAPWLATIG